MYFLYLLFFFSLLQLVKSRVQISNQLSRVGFKVRANPSNTELLTNIVIVMAVPPYVQGDTVKMSRKGGIWDEMKRIICWTIPTLNPGEVIEIQAQFQTSGNLPKLDQSDFKFPILVRCDSNKLFSGIEVSITSTTTDNQSFPLVIKSEVSKTTCILHRKV